MAAHCTPGTVEVQSKGQKSTVRKREGTVRSEKVGKFRKEREQPGVFSLSVWAGGIQCSVVVLSIPTH